MTTDQLHDLIAGDPVATKLADEGRDYEAAVRASEIAPPEAPVQKPVEVGLVVTADDVSKAWAINRKEGFIK